MRILVIRGGALGDLIVTLPTIEALRRAYPEAHLELLGHPHLAGFTEKRGYFDRLRSVERGPLSTFFVPHAKLDPEWIDYFGSFDLVISYFFDPDEIFRTNLARCEPGRIITHPSRVPPDYDRPAAFHFAGVLEPLGLELKSARARVYPNSDDAAAAAKLLPGTTPEMRLLAIHPGSGSEAKNWPPAAWAELGESLLATQTQTQLLLVGGEADRAPLAQLETAWQGRPLVVANSLPLPTLAALLAQAALFIGHDSGVTHLAAAVRSNLPVLALFGPTDPAVWAPPGPNVEALRASASLAALPVSAVVQAAERLLRTDQN